MNIGNAQLSHIISENRRHWPIIQPILFDSIEIPLVYLTVPQINGSQYVQSGVRERGEILGKLQR